MKVYLAASSRDLTLVQYWMDACEAAGGITISYNWIPDVERAVRGASVSDETMREVAQRDAEGVRTADVVWVLCTERPTAGAWWELGYACGLWSTSTETLASLGRAPVVIVSGEYRRCIFTVLDSIQRFDTHEAAFAWLVELCRVDQ